MTVINCGKYVNEKFDKLVSKENKEKERGDINALCSC